MIDRNKLAGMGAGLLAATVMFGAGSAGAQPAAGEYVFGFVTETTGPLAAAGVSYHRGAQVAVEEINAKGVDGLIETLAARNKANAGTNAGVAGAK